MTGRETRAPNQQMQAIGAGAPQPDLRRSRRGGANVRLARQSGARARAAAARTRAWTGTAEDGSAALGLQARRLRQPADWQTQGAGQAARSAGDVRTFVFTWCIPYDTVVL